MVRIRRQKIRCGFHLAVAELLRPLADAARLRSVSVGSPSIENSCRCFLGGKRPTIVMRMLWGREPVWTASVYCDIARVDVALAVATGVGGGVVPWAAPRRPSDHADGPTPTTKWARCRADGGLARGFGGGGGRGRAVVARWPSGSHDRSPFTNITWSAMPLMRSGVVRLSDESFHVCPPPTDVNRLRRPARTRCWYAGSRHKNSLR